MKNSLLKDIWHTKDWLFWWFFFLVLKASNKEKKTTSFCTYLNADMVQLTTRINKQIEIYSASL